MSILLFLLLELVVEFLDPEYCRESVKSINFIYFNYYFIALRSPPLKLFKRGLCKGGLARAGLCYVKLDVLFMMIYLITLPDFFTAGDSICPARAARVSNDFLFSFVTLMPLFSKFPRLA